jgi:hypothetical protein
MTEPQLAACGSEPRPRVSICVPNLNTRPFLPERFRTIRLVAGAVHVPETWGGWRVHPQRATAAVRPESPEHWRTIDAMIEDAIGGCWALLTPAVREQLESAWLAQAREFRTFTLETSRRRHSAFPRRGVRLAGHLLAGSAAARAYVLARLLRRQPADWMRRRLDNLRGEPSLVPMARVGAT